MRRQAPEAQRRPGVTRVFAALGGEVDEALERIRVPAFVIDAAGRIRYQNRTSRDRFGDAAGRSFADLVAPQSKPSARLHFTRQLLGADAVSDNDVWLRTRDGDVLAEVHGVAIEADGRVVGVFGIVEVEAEALTAPARGGRHRLTPRQREVLERLGEGRSTAQIAEAMSISTETVRNHVRAILRTLGVHSRLEAVVEAHRLGLLAG